VEARDNHPIWVAERTRLEAATADKAAALAATQSELAGVRAALADSKSLVAQLEFELSSEWGAGAREQRGGGGGECREGRGGGLSASHTPLPAICALYHTYTFLPPMRNDFAHMCDVQTTHPVPPLPSHPSSPTLHTHNSWCRGLRHPAAPPPGPGGEPCQGAGQPGGAAAAAGGPDGARRASSQGQAGAGAGGAGEEGGGRGCVSLCEGESVHMHTWLLVKLQAPFQSRMLNHS
jgi:hypothetical protein